MATARAGQATAGLPSEMLDTTWNLVSLQPDGQVAQDVAGGGITIMFTAQGEFSGSGGCNSYSGTYEAPGGQALTIKQPIAATRMACEDPAGSLEFQYFDALGTVQSYTLDGATRTAARPRRQRQAGLRIGSARYAARDGQCRRRPRVLARTGRAAAGGRSFGAQRAGPPHRAGTVQQGSITLDARRWSHVGRLSGIVAEAGATDIVEGVELLAAAEDIATLSGLVGVMSAGDLEHG